MDSGAEAAVRCLQLSLLHVAISVAACSIRDAVAQMDAAGGTTITHPHIRAEQEVLWTVKCGVPRRGLK